MTVCIDTNALLQARSPVHRYHALLTAWLRGRFAWAVSTEILFEYEEVITTRTGTQRWLEIELMIKFAMRFAPQRLPLIAPTFQFHLITACPDDNKFADCAIAAEADFIITDDRHFDALAESGYKPQPISPAEFIRRFLTP